MRYGGHQTFFVREGWLHKAMGFLLSSDEKERMKLHDDYAADYLGVGRNMAFSINHWLLAVGLAKKPEKTDQKRHAHPVGTNLAHELWITDRYMVMPETWWILHINLLTNEDYAATWTWFFHHYHKDRFDKSSALESLKQWQLALKGSCPTINKLERDLAVFLASYSRVVPPLEKDPEEEIDCPFRELGLMSHFRSSGYYLLHRETKQIPLSAMLYCLNIAVPEDLRQGETKMIQVRFSDLLQWQLAPTKVFAMTNDGLFSALEELASQGNDILLRGLAGERMVHFRSFPEPHRVISWCRSEGPAGRES